jgi:hypothetical protein
LDGNRPVDGDGGGVDVHLVVAAGFGLQGYCSADGFIGLVGGVRSVELDLDLEELFVVGQLADDHLARHASI